VQTVPTAVEPVEDAVTDGGRVGDPKRRLGEWGGGDEPAGLGISQPVQAPRPPHCTKLAVDHHHRHATVAPRHLIGQGTVDDHPAVRGIEAGVAAPLQVLPPIVVDQGCRELAADCPQQPTVPCEGRGPEGQVNLEQPLPEPPVVQRHKRGTALAAHGEQLVAAGSEGGEGGDPPPAFESHLRVEGRLPEAHVHGL
jgi:hypothetical protein